MFVDEAWQTRIGNLPRRVDAAYAVRSISAGRLGGHPLDDGVPSKEHDETANEKEDHAHVEDAAEREKAEGYSVVVW